MSGISAQKSKLEVGTGSGAAQAITAIAAGFPTIVTIVGHGRKNGDVVALAAITGTIAALLNGTSRTISNVTADTYALADANSVGLAYANGGTATPTTWTKVNGCLSFDGLDGAADDLETTDLDSDAKEFINGIIDNGKFGFEIKRLAADAGQNAMRAARTSGALLPFRLTLPDVTVATWNGLVKTMPVAGGVNAVMKGKVDTRITGTVSWA